MNIFLSIRRVFHTNPTRVVKASRAETQVKVNDNPWMLAPSDYWDAKKFDSDAFVTQLQESNQEAAKWIKGIKREMRASAIRVSRMIIS